VEPLDESHVSCDPAGRGQPASGRWRGDCNEARQRSKEV